jgi:HSP20 family molecular chaperone IbpA
MFSRTVYLPERVDGANVKAKLEHTIAVEVPDATQTLVTEVTGL